MKKEKDTSFILNPSRMAVRTNDLHVNWREKVLLHYFTLLGVRFIDRFSIAVLEAKPTCGNS